jgi:hypothetical protein
MHNVKLTGSPASGESELNDGLEVNRANVVSCCPECWFENRATMIETSKNDGFVSCPHHGEMTISHFISRMTEVEKELADRGQQNQLDICKEGTP